ncbi:MAG: hypothetical protein KDJ75_01580 [Alphaproteobacteria bacterium]|nr:hypothetical protein [Alphaproteobacteria bacterium]
MANITTDHIAALISASTLSSVLIRGGMGGADVQFFSDLGEIIQSGRSYIWLENEDGSVSPVDVDTYLDAISGNMIPEGAQRPLASDQTQEFNPDNIDLSHVPEEVNQKTGHFIELLDGTVKEMTLRDMNDHIYGQLEGDYIKNFQVSEGGGTLSDGTIAEQLAALDLESVNRSLEQDLLPSNLDLSLVSLKPTNFTLG